jgi:NADH:ubiquinone oxidoreductase subunit 2 (subunit N)
MADWANIPWVLLLPLTAGAGLVAFENAHWSRKSLTICAIVAFAFCGVAFTQMQQAPTTWCDSIVFVVVVVGIACLLCSLDDENDSLCLGRQAATMLFAVGCLAVLCFATSLPTLLAAFGAFIVTQSATLRLSNQRGQIRSTQNTAAISFVLMTVGLVFLFALTRATELSDIHRILSDSYEPTRSDLYVGEASFLGVVALVLIIGASALLVGAIPFHVHGEDQFEHQPGWLAVWMGVCNRGFAFVLLWRILSAMAGFQLDAQLILIVCAVFSAIGGACLAVRAQNLRAVFHAGWIVSGGVLLMTLAIGVRQSNQINADQWHFPDVFETALTGFAVSSVALLVGIACEHTLRLPMRRIDFVEDLAGLSKRRPKVAIMLTASMLTICAFPPLPGFWNVVFMTVNAYAPQAESPDSPVLIPNTAVLIANALVVVSLVFVAARMIDFFSMMFHEQPLARHAVQRSSMSFVVAAVFAGWLLFMGIHPSTLIWATHALAQPEVD